MKTCSYQGTFLADIMSNATFILNSLGLHRFYQFFLNYYKSVVFIKKDQAVSVILEGIFTSK